MVKLDVQRYFGVMMGRTAEWMRVAGVCALLAGLVGCGQSQQPQETSEAPRAEPAANNAPLPVAQGEQANELDDIRRDLHNVAANERNAASDLLQDLAALPLEAPPAAPLQALTDALSGALSGTRLEDADARQLANLLFATVSGEELNDAQVSRVGNEMRTILVRAGANKDAADRAANAALALTREKQAAQR